MWRDLPTFQAGSSSKVESYPKISLLRREDEGQIIRVFGGISLEGRVLLVMSFVDCLVSAVLFQFGLAQEFYPLMGWLLRGGIPVFVVGKVLISAVLVLILETFRWSGAASVKYLKFWQRGAIVIYPSQIFIANLIYV